MHLKLISALVATSLGAAPALAQELTGTLKKIKETGAEISLRCIAVSAVS